MTAAQYLDCPECGDPCTTIPSCQEAHLGCTADIPDGLDHSWCEERRGTCDCGAVLRVSVDYDRASLEVDEGGGT